MSAHEKYTRTEMIRVLTMHHGSLTRTAKALGCTAETVRNYMRRYEEVAHAAQEARQRGRLGRVRTADKGIV